MIKHNQFNQKWVELLTNNNSEEEAKFYEITKDSPSLELAIMKYRRILREEGRGEISLEDLKINMDNKDKLQDLLQELFLEPISLAKINMIKKRNIDIEKLYGKYEENKNRRFVNAVLTI